MNKNEINAKLADNLNLPVSTVAKVTKGLIQLNLEFVRLTGTKEGSPLETIYNDFVYQLDGKGRKKG